MANPGKYTKTVVTEVNAPEVHEIPVTLNCSGPGGAPAFMPDVKIPGHYWKFYDEKTDFSEESRKDPEVHALWLLVEQDQTRPTNDRLTRPVSAERLERMREMREWVTSLCHEDLGVETMEKAVSE